MSIFVRARLDVRDGRQADFEKIVRTLRAQADEEPGTRTYRFFEAGEGGYLVLEEYTDTEAALAHNERAAHLLPRLRECTDLTFIEFYGPVGPELQAIPNATAYPEFTGAAG